jgi:hypothetical protein
MHLRRRNDETFHGRKSVFLGEHRPKVLRVWSDTRNKHGAVVRDIGVCKKVHEVPEPAGMAGTYNEHNPHDEVFSKIGPNVRPT